MVNAYRTIPQLRALNKMLALIEDSQTADSLREIRDDLEKSLRDAGMDHLIPKGSV